MDDQNGQLRLPLAVLLLVIALGGAVDLVLDRDPPPGGRSMSSTK